MADALSQAEARADALAAQLAAVRAAANDAPIRGDDLSPADDRWGVGFDEGWNEAIKHIRCWLGAAPVDVPREAPFPRPADLLLDAKHDDPDPTGPLVDFEAEPVDVPQPTPTKRERP